MSWKWSPQVFSMYPLARNQYINNSPGIFSCIRAGANTGATCIRPEIISFKILANMQKMTPQKYFPVFARVRIQAPHAFAEKLIPQEMFPACIGLCRGVCNVFVGRRLMHHQNVSLQNAPSKRTLLTSLKRSKAGPPQLKRSKKYVLMVHFAVIRFDGASGACQFWGAGYSFMLGQGCLRTLFRKRFPHPLNRVKNCERGGPLQKCKTPDPPKCSGECSGRCWPETRCSGRCSEKCCPLCLL